MTSKKNKRKKPSDASDDSTASSHTTLDEEDVIKIINRLKFDLNDSKNPLSLLIKSYFSKFKLFLDDLVQNDVVESYDTFGGFRFGYLLINDINIDVLVKTKNKDDFKRILNYFKNNLGNLCVNSNENNQNKSPERKDSYFVNLYVLNNLNTNNNILNKVLIISFNHKKGKRDFKFKLYFTNVKYDLKNNTRKTNINEYIIQELDEINSKYTNISNAVILLKLFLHTFNLSPFPLFFDWSSTSSSTGNKGKKLLERKFASSELNGHVFNLIITHMCVVNNYSCDTKAVILFKNTLSYLCNLYKKLNKGEHNQDLVLLYCDNTTDSNPKSTSTTGSTSSSNRVTNDSNNWNDKGLLLKKELLGNEFGPKLLDYYRQLASNEFERKLVMKVEKYPQVNLLEQVQMVLPQLVYYSEIGLNILNSRFLSKNEKMIQLLLRKNRLSNFYENYLTFKCCPEEVKYGVEQLIFLLKYGLKERLQMIHVYHIHSQHLVYTYDTTTGNSTGSNTTNTLGSNTSNTNYNRDNKDNNDTEELKKTDLGHEIDTDNDNKEDYHVMLYFTFDNDVQSTEDYGPSYTPSNLVNTNTLGSTTGNSNSNKMLELEKRLVENEFYKMFWGDRCQLVKSNNRIQYYVDLSLISPNTFNENNTTGSNTTNRDNTTVGSSNKSSNAKSNQEERLFLQREELKGNINLEIVKHIEKRLLSKEVFMCLNNFNVRYPLINEQHKALVSTTNDFTDILRNLDEPPLKILNTQVLCESYCYCNVYNFYNLYDYFYNNFNSQSVKLSVKSKGNVTSSKDLERKLLERDKVIRILVRWESSNKWPREEEAFNKVVMSLLLTISKELKNRFGLYTLVTNESLLVFYNNYLYEIIPVNTSGTSSSSRDGKNIHKGNGSSRDSNTGSNTLVSTTTSGSNTNLLANTLKTTLDKSESKEELERKYRLMEDCRNAVMTNLNFVGCVRLLKLFFSRYLRLDLDEFTKLLCLQIYNENNHIKSSNSTIQFLQVLFNMSNINLVDESTNKPGPFGVDNTSSSTTGVGSSHFNSTTSTSSNRHNMNSSNYNFIGLLNDNRLFSSSTRDLVVRYCRTILSHVNTNLVTLPLGSLECNEGEGNEKMGFRDLVDISKLEMLLYNTSNYNMVIELNNIYYHSNTTVGSSNKSGGTSRGSNTSGTSSSSRDGNKMVEEMEYKKYNCRDWYKCIIRYLKNNLNEVAEVYYYKYKLFNYFNTKSYKDLNLYLRFDKFKFVPRLHFKQRNYPQSVVVVSSHLSHLNKLKKLGKDHSNTSGSNTTDKSTGNTVATTTSNSNRDKKNNLVSTTGYSDITTYHDFESIVDNDYQYGIQNVQESVIIVPNIILIMKMLTTLTKGTLNNLVFL